MNPDASGWPFLIGAGRRHEYRTLVAPDFLVQDAEYGVLDRYVGRTAAGETGIVEISSAKRPLWAAYRTETVTDADVADPRDEHSRPLQVMVGFVSRAPIRDADAGDLAVARDSGMAVYRRYLDDEDRFGVVSSESFPLRSAIRPALGTAAATPLPPPRRTGSVVGVAAVVVAALVAVLVVTLSGGDGDGPDRIDPSCGPTPVASAPACR